MSELKKKLNDILKDIEKNVKNKDDLEYIKSQIYNISLLFLDEIDKLGEMNLERLNVMIERDKELSQKITNMERIVSNIEREMFIPSDCDFEILCPYCNTEFVEDFTNGMKHEVRCPECGNAIELDWNEEESCGCHDCNGEGCECCDDDDDIEGEEDDM